MTTQSTLVQMNRHAVGALAKAAQELGDKIDWKPLGKGRSALDQVQECASLASMVAIIFETGTVPPINRETLAQFRLDYDTPEKALGFLNESLERMAAAIEAFPTEKLSDTVTLPFGGGMTKSFAEVAQIFYWNTVYHEGQINYIQTLAAPDEA